MRVFKKIMYIILALVPILPLLLFGLGNIGNINGVDVMPFGVLSIRQVPSVDEGYVSENYIVVESDTILSHFLSGVIPRNIFIRNMDSVVIGEEDYEIQEVFGVPAGEYDVYFHPQLDSVEPRFFDRILSIYGWFTNAGITPPPYVVFLFGYLCYMLFIHVSFMIFDLIVFVPRKISEMLEV